MILVGGRAAYSPDGKWFAYSARPADASVGPDVYVWQVGDDRSRAVTADHAAVFAGWVGDTLLVSSPDAASVKPMPVPDAAAKAATEKAESQGKSASATPRASATPEATTGANASATPAPKPKKTAKPAATADADAASAPAEDVPPTPSAIPGPATVPVTYLLDPANGVVTPIDLPGLWLPSVDPTGTRIVGWLGTVRPDPATRSWRPAGGSLVVGSWATVSGESDATPSASAETTPSATPAVSAKPTKGPKKTAVPAETAVPAGDAPAPAATADAETASPTPEANADGAGTAVATPSATAEADPSATPSMAPGAGAPAPLGIPSLVGRLPATWQVRWDPSGTHLAIWVQGAANPEVGSLTLIAFDPAGAKAPKALLSATPAMPGFAVGKTRIAWATPSVTAAGGRVRVLVWSGPAVGEAGTAPIRGLETLVEGD